MNTVTITIGWTKHEEPRGMHRGQPYTPFLDTYRPGQPQHTETVTVELPDITEHPVNISGQDLAEAAFHATNAPFVTEDSLAARVLDAIAATGYRGEEAHYSLSVGDTVTVQGTTYACARLGWEVLA